MTTPSLSSETLHASSVAKDGRAILISGRSGAGKSDLALRLIDRGATLISDDYTIVRRVNGRLVATAFLIGALSVAGIPPTAGFFGKAALFQAGIDAGSIATVALLFVGGALSFVYLFQIYQHDRWRPREERERVMPSEPASRGQRSVAVAVAVVVLAIGLWPEPLLAIGDRAAHELVATEPDR